MKYQRRIGTMTYRRQQKLTRWFQLLVLAASAVTHCISFSTISSLRLSFGRRRRQETCCPQELGARLLLSNDGVLVRCSTITTTAIRMRPNALFMSGNDNEATDSVDFNSLIDMDVVVYSNRDDPKGTKHLAALEEDGSLAPLSAWTTEHAFGTCVEFLVDEEDRFNLPRHDEATKVINIHYRMDESELSYGSRQCNRGSGNPHGEESELLYYVEQDVLDKFDIDVIIKPELEILW